MWKDRLTNNFHVDICSVFSSRVSNHNGIDPLILPLRPLDGEDAVSLGGFNMDSGISLCDNLQHTIRTKSKKSHSNGIDSSVANDHGKGGTCYNPCFVHFKFEEISISKFIELF